MAKLVGLKQQVCVLLLNLSCWSELKQAGAKAYYLVNDSHGFRLGSQLRSQLRSQLEAALKACSRVVHIGPFLPTQADWLTELLIQCAQQQGIKHFVSLSPLHSQYIQAFHPAVLAAETRLIESGLPATLLHTAPYMQNLLRLWHRIKSEAVYQTPIDATAHFSVVDLQDVAEATAIVVAEGGHEYACYELAGPQPLNQRDMVDIIAAVTGQVIHLEVISLEGKPFDRVAAEQWLDRCSEAQCQQLLLMLQYCNDHGLVGNPNVLSWLLGRQPTSFTQFVESLHQADKAL